MSNNLDQIRADLDLLWECYFAWENKVVEFGEGLLSYVKELEEAIQKHSKEDYYFKKDLSETHKQNYEKFESLFLKIKQLFGSKGRVDTEALSKIYSNKGRGGEEIKGAQDSKEC